MEHREPPKASALDIYSVQDVLRKRHAQFLRDGEPRKGSVGEVSLFGKRTSRMRTIGDIERETRAAREAAKAAAAAEKEAASAVAAPKKKSGDKIHVGNDGASFSREDKAKTAQNEMRGYILGGRDLPSRVVVTTATNPADFARAVSDFMIERGLDEEFREFLAERASGRAHSSVQQKKAASARTKPIARAASPTPSKRASAPHVGSALMSADTHAMLARVGAAPPPIVHRPLPVVAHAHAHTHAPTPSSSLGSAAPHAPAPAPAPLAQRKRPASPAASLFDKLAAAPKKTRLSMPAPSFAPSAALAYAPEPMPAPTAKPAEKTTTAPNDGEFAHILEQLRAPIADADKFSRDEAPWDTVVVGGHAVHRFLCRVPRFGSGPSVGAGSESDGDDDHDHEIIGYVNSELAALLGADRIAAMRAASPSPAESSIAVDARLFTSLQRARVGMPAEDAGARTRRQTERALATAQPLTPLSMLVSWALTWDHTVVTLSSQRKRKRT